MIMLTNVNGGGRNFSLDVLKTIAITLVIIYHCGLFHDYISAAILSMCVPIFFCINGSLMLRKEYSYLYLLRKNIKIFFLIVIWGLVYSYVGSLSLGEEVTEVMSLYRQIGHPLKGDHLWFLMVLFSLNIFNPLIYSYIKPNRKQRAILLVSLFTVFTLNLKGDHLWFLMVLFSLNIFNPLIYSYIKPNRKQRAILLVSLFTVFTLNIIVFRIPFNLRPFSLWGSWALIYYMIGYLIIDCKIVIGNKRISCFLFAVVSILQMLYNYLQKDASNLVPGGYQSPFVILMVSFLIMTICTDSINILQNRFISFIGKHTLGIYLFQGILIRLLYEKMQGNMLFPVIVFVLCILLVYCLDTNKYSRYFITLNTLTSNKYDGVIK